MVTSSRRRISHCLYWDKEGRSIKSYCILHLTAPDNDYIRKKNPHHTLTICEMMQLMGSSHTTPTEIVLRASWRDWFSIILTRTNRTVCMCHCMFTVTFMEIHLHWLLHSLHLETQWQTGQWEWHCHIKRFNSQFSTQCISSQGDLFPSLPYRAGISQLKQVHFLGWFGCSDSAQIPEALIKSPKPRNQTTTYSSKMINNHAWEMATAWSTGRAGTACAALLSGGWACCLWLYPTVF